MTCNNKKCECPNCSMKRGQVHIQIMIGNQHGMPVPVGSIRIDTDPFVVEDWMLEKVATDAAKSLTKFVLDSNSGKVIN